MRGSRRRRFYDDVQAHRPGRVGCDFPRAAGCAGGMGSGARRPPDVHRAGAGGGDRRGHPRRRACRGEADRIGDRRPRRCSRAARSRSSRPPASSVKLTRNKKGQTVIEQAAAMAVERLQRVALLGRAGRHPRRAATALARENPQLVKLEVLGHTQQGRELIALKVTQGARGVPDGSRPAVLYSSNQHAREWISVEVNRRTAALLRRQLAGERQGRSRTCSRAPSCGS